MKPEEITFPGDEPSNLPSNTKWSALKSYTHK